MSHLCRLCREMMCPDCLEIAGEYAELLGNYKRALFTLEQRVKKLETEKQKAQRLDYAEARWMDSQL